MINAGKLVLKQMLGMPNWMAAFLLALRGDLVHDLRRPAGERHDRCVPFRVACLLLPPLFLYVLLFHHEGGAAAFSQQAVRATAEGFGSLSTMQLISLIAAFLLGETLIPPYANLTLASKTVNVSRSSFILAGLFSILWFLVMIGLGIVARATVAPDTAEDQVLISLVKTRMPAVGYACTW